MGMDCDGDQPTPLNRTHVFRVDPTSQGRVASRFPALALQSTRLMLVGFGGWASDFGILFLGFGVLGFEIYKLVSREASSEPAGFVCLGCRAFGCLLLPT